MDNASKAFDTVVPTYTDNVKILKDIRYIIRRRDHQPRLLERCFSEGDAVLHVRRIQKFRGHAHEGRWGTVDFSVPELRAVEIGMRVNWCAKKFITANANGVNRLPIVGTETKAVVENADRGIKDAVFPGMAYNHGTSVESPCPGTCAC